ncbi:MAG: hypothetical protein ACYCS1_05375 [Gammaproteobacteria bacterium]
MKRELIYNGIKLDFSKARKINSDEYAWEYYLFDNGDLYKLRESELMLFNGLKNINSIELKKLESSEKKNEIRINLNWLKEYKKDKSNYWRKWVLISEQELKRK